MTRIIFHDAGDDVAGKGAGACVFPESSELVGGTVIPVKPSAAGGYPDIPFVILDDVGDEIIADAAFVLWVIAVDDDTVTVVFIESVAGAKPDEAAAVLEDVEDIVLGQTGIYVQVLKFQTRLLSRTVVTQDGHQQTCQGCNFKGLE